MPPLPDWERLSLAEQVAQLVVVRASGHLFDQQIQYPNWEPAAPVLRHWLQDLGVGGVILLGGSAVEVGVRSQQLQEWARLPLLIAADVEEGVGQRFAGATWFPPPMALAAIARQDAALAIALAEQMGAFTAQEALAIGINWVLAPVVDVNNNPANPVINLRAFGETVEVVGQLTTAFLRGAQRHPVLTAAKHFPGHGDTAIDSHLALPVLPHQAPRLDQIEWPPFRAAIATGVDAVITAHVQLPALDPTYPATLSPAILAALRQQLGFEGLIVTDALIMGAITDRYGLNEAPVLAVQAGADIVLMPADPEGAIQALCAAVEAGQIPIEQIYASLARIWRAKRRVHSPAASNFPHAWEQLPPPIQLDRLAQPAALNTAADILRHSMQIYCPAAPLRPESISNGPPPRNLIVVDDLLNCAFLSRQAPAIGLPQERGYRLQVIDRHTPAVAMNHAAEPQPTLLQLFIRDNPFRASATVLQLGKDWLQFLEQTGQLQALVVYGSPYAFEQLRPLIPTQIPYVFSYGQLPAAQSLVLNRLLDAEPAEVAARLDAERDREFTD